MRRLFLIAGLLIFVLNGFTQQEFPEKIIGRIPNNESAKIYQIQVGAFKIAANTESAVNKLKNNNLNPVTEKYLDFTRVIIKGIRANQVAACLVRIKQSGFNEVIIREDVHLSIAEKWEVNIQESAYKSIEFNHDMNFIAVEKNDIPYFGSYFMPQSDIINLEEIGVIKIKKNNADNVDFSFAFKNEPGKEINFSASKAEKLPASNEVDLLCRTWKVVDCTDKNYIGDLLFISNAGTYFFTTNKGELNFMSKWRWAGGKKDEFEYTHDDWRSYGRAKITGLSINSLRVFDPGYQSDVSGYSEAGFNDRWEFVPAR